MTINEENDGLFGRGKNVYLFLCLQNLLCHIYSFVKEKEEKKKKYKKITREQ